MRIVLTDRVVIIGAFVVAAGLLALGATIVPAGIRAIEAASYERPATISAEVEAFAQSAADQIIEGTTIRFDAESACLDGQVACVRGSDHLVIHLPEDVNAAAPMTLAAVAIHEAAHSAEFEHDLDVSAFGSIDPEVSGREAFADCAAAALTPSPTRYVECPVEWQARALDLLGIER